ncbi:MAG: ABC transporter permease [Anaerolineae bacterium]|nr:ABC transporter permease [Anaerolineae bacterium]
MIERIQNLLHSDQMGKWVRPFFTQVLIVLLAFVLGGFVILGIGADPIAAYAALIKSAFGNVNSIAETLVKACPLLLAGLAITLAFRAEFWNIGAEGQLYMGGVLAAVVGIYFTGLPPAVHIPLALIAGVLGGAIAGFIPVILKAKLRVNEVITTLMLNYIIILFTSYLDQGPMSDPIIKAGISRRLLETSWIPIMIKGTRFHWGIPLALLITILIAFLLSKTMLGFQIRAVGENARAARVAGVSINKTIIWTMILSGALAGLAGGIEISGVQHRLIERFSPGYGFLAIAVALVGRLSPIGVIFSSVLFAALIAGADTMQRVAGVPIPVVYLIEGLVIIFASIRSIRIRSPFRRKVTA